MGIIEGTNVFPFFFSVLACSTEYYTHISCMFTTGLVGMASIQTSLPLFAFGAYHGAGTEDTEGGKGGTRPGGRFYTV